MWYEQLHCEVTFSALIEEAFIFFIWNIIMNNILLICVNKLLNILEWFGVTELLWANLLLLIRQFSVVRINHGHDIFLILVFFEGLVSIII